MAAVSLTEVVNGRQHPVHALQRTGGVSREKKRHGVRTRKPAFPCGLTCASVVGVQPTRGIMHDRHGVHGDPVVVLEKYPVRHSAHAPAATGP